MRGQGLPQWGKGPAGTDVTAASQVARAAAASGLLRAVPQSVWHAAQTSHGATAQSTQSCMLLSNHTGGQHCTLSKQAGRQPRPAQPRPQPTHRKVNPRTVFRYSSLPSLMMGNLIEDRSVVVE
jgi:hypothetical protein